MTEDPTLVELSLTLSKRLPAPPDRVFAAWTSAESIQKWLCPYDTGKIEAELDLRVGGRYRIDMHGESGVFKHTGEYREIDPPSRLVFTWVSPATAGLESVVTIELAPAGDGETDLTLTHEGFPDVAATDRHRGGWGSILQRLATEMTI